MPSRERPADRGRRRIRASLGRVVADVRAARVGAGLSLEAVAEAVGVSHSRISRLERGAIEHPPVDFVAAVCAVVGLDLVIKAYPSGDPLRDRAHDALLGRLRAVLDPSLRLKTEQPLPILGDLRAWDGTIIGRGWLCHVEAETAITDGQALLRRLSLKARDGGRGNVVLLVSDTRMNRDALHTLRPSITASLPLGTRSILGSLRRGEEPRESGIVVL
jgi:transcriptional regulator with XRE-family HTH domain